MKSPRFLGSRVVFWFVAPWVLLGLVAFIFVAKGSFESGETVAGLLASYCAALCVIGLYAMLAPRHGLIVGRVIAGTLALAYVGYFVLTCFIEGQPFRFTTQRSQATPFNAVLGFIVIGLPCAHFALTGRPFWSSGAKRGESAHPSPEHRT